MAFCTKRTLASWVTLAWVLATLSPVAAQDRAAEVLESIAPPGDWLNDHERAQQYPLRYEPIGARQPAPAIEGAPSGELWSDWYQPSETDSFDYGYNSDYGYYSSDGYDDDSNRRRNRRNNSGLTAWVDWIFLSRSRTGDQLLLVGPGGEALSSETFGFDFQPGIETGLELSLGNTVAAEFRYFWVHDWTASATVADPAGLSLATLPSTGPFGTPLTMSYRSELESFEFNFRTSMGDFTWLAGFRYMAIDERLRFCAPSVLPLPGAAGNFDVENDLSGFQIGADALLWDDGNMFTLSGVAKTGIYYVEANASTVGALGPAPATIVAGRSSAEEVAFVGEFGLDSTLMLTRSLRLRTGYRVIYVDGIAAASSLVSHSDALAASTPMRVHADNSILYHGLNVGLELSW